MAIVTDMAGRTGLVTGAASGLGRATALALARAGADVCLVDVNADGLETAADEVRELGRTALVHPADLSDPAACGEVVAAAVDAFGRLDALCNVAGLIRFAHSTDVSDADWNRTLAVNLTAPFLLSRAAIPHLIAVDGAIVNVVSTAAFIGEAYAAAYCASKAGLLAMTKALAMEYMHSSIRINALAPGGMATNIAAGMRMPDGADMALLARFKPLRGLADVDETAEMIAHLASPGAQAFHGACVTMDRGILAG